MTDQGLPWTPIGQNDAITWPELHGLIGRRDLSAVERHLRRLSDTGITCLRLMLEYCEDEECHLERPAGSFRPLMVALWDDLVGLCAQLGLRLLLTPFDTFFTWNNWADARTHQGSPRLCQRAMGFERGGIRVGSVERDAPGAGPGPS
jgi:mannan endo-1,4-beta-mannosidase